MNSLLFYIGNGLVKCAMVNNATGSLPEVLFWEKLDITHPETIDQEGLHKATVSALDAVCRTSNARLLSGGIKNKRISRIFCVFSSPWYSSETKVLRTSKLEPFMVKEDTVRHFIESSRMETGEGAPEKMAVLERKIIKTSLNGYVTEKPIGKRANILEVSVIESFIDESFLKEVEKTILRYFEGDEKHFHSLALVSFAVIRNLFKAEKGFIMVNMTSLLTEISLAKDGLLHETTTLPLGSQKLVQMVTERLKVTPAVAVTLLDLYQKEQAESSVKEKLRLIIEEFKKSWGESLKEALSHLSGGLSLPDTCYLICQTNLRNLFSGFMEGEKFRVENISDASLSPFIRFKTESPDPSVAIMALFANIIL